MKSQGTLAPAANSAFTLTAQQEQAIDGVVTQLRRAREQLGRAVIGQDDMLDHVVWTLISGGHALFVGVPGTAKTVLVSSVGKVFGLDEKRVQCTPDLMPSDILGSEVLETVDGQKEFRFIKGPVFSQLFFTDELNRASPRTQSATLQAMQEGKVTAGGQDHRLPKPFHMLATQNPMDQEGTNPLPEAQKDRFLIEYEIEYPDYESEMKVMLGTTTTQHSLDKILFETDPLDPPGGTMVSPKDLEQVMTADQLIRVQHLIRKMPLSDAVCGAILDLVRGARPDFDKEAETASLKNVFNFVSENISYGPGTRALQAFALMTRARALMRGDFTPSVDDVKALAVPILRHRIIPNRFAEMTDIDGNPFKQGEGKRVAKEVFVIRQLANRL